MKTKDAVISELADALAVFLLAKEHREGLEKDPMAVNQAREALKGAADHSVGARRVFCEVEAVWKPWGKQL